MLVQLIPRASQSKLNTRRPATSSRYLFYAKQVLQAEEDILVHKKLSLIHESLRRGYIEGSTAFARENDVSSLCEGKAKESLR